MLVHIRQSHPDQPPIKTLGAEALVSFPVRWHGICVVTVTQSLSEPPGASSHNLVPGILWTSLHMFFFLFAEFASYLSATINHSHEHNYILSSEYS